MATRITRQVAIRRKCLECMNGQRREVVLCPCTDCPLYAYRLGHEEKTGHKAEGS